MGKKGDKRLPETPLGTLKADDGEAINWEGSMGLHPFAAEATGTNGNDTELTRKEMCSDKWEEAGKHLCHRFCYVRVIHPEPVVEFVWKQALSTVFLVNTKLNAGSC